MQINSDLTRNIFSFIFQVHRIHGQLNEGRESLASFAGQLGPGGTAIGHLGWHGPETFDSG